MRAACLIALLLLMVGCKSRPNARYVSRTAQTGVVAMPADTPENRMRAEALMHSQFPEGYEIIAEGEQAVVTPLPASANGAGSWRHNETYLAAGTDDNFQQAIEDLPGSPQSMQGYARPAPPPVALHVHTGEPPPPPANAYVRNEWRIIYRRKGSGTASPSPGTGESLFPAGE